MERANKEKYPMDKDDFKLHPSVSGSCQLRTLTAIETQIRNAVNEGIRPVIEIDLDLCALRPVYRTRQALMQVGHEFSIAEFTEPDLLGILPGYSDEAWGAFLSGTHLERTYPELKWRENGRLARSHGTPFGRFHQLYWTTAWMSEDEPTPGLGSFVHHIELFGACCVFLSGRWEDEHVDPSLESLKRSGIPNPNLVIGNPWHETKASSPQSALSDSAVKAWRQKEIHKRFGTPVAIIDDRISNRNAVLSESPTPMLSIAIAIPGFTCDANSINVTLRISTFEQFCQTIDSPPQRPLMRTRYPTLGYGQSWRGEYTGLGKNGLGYCLPKPEGQVTVNGDPPFGMRLPTIEGKITEEQALELFETTIPHEELTALGEAYHTARELAALGLAAPWNGSSAEENGSFEKNLWRSLICAWLHSRDMEILMNALGFPRILAGIHDLRECVELDEVRSLLLSTSPVDSDRIRRANYSPWLVAWAKQLREEQVNVSFLNPHLLVDLCLWTPKRQGSQDAMDVHRLSDHHDGDGLERYDPIEAGVNNLLHQREGRFGVRKESVVSWGALRESAATETGSTDLSKNSASRKVLSQAIDTAEKLEASGWMTPWSVCERIG
jgi:hypothetical protein